MNTEQSEFVQEYNGVIIDYSRDNLLPEQGKAMLTKKGFYKKDYETSPQQGFARAATCFSFGDYELAQRIYDAVSKGWFTFASPVLSNSVLVEWPTFEKDQFEEAGEWLEDNVTPDGQPISCFLSMIPDNKQGLVEARKETSWLSMMGGGNGIFPNIRSPDEKSTGVMAHLRGYDADTLSYKQTSSRRGSIAAYLDINHPEIQSFLQMRNPVGGDTNKKCFNMNNAVNITDEFMGKVARGEEYELVDPEHGNTGRFLNARKVWEEIMELRFETGEPYLHFVDTVNKNLPDCIKHPLYKVTQSNLCIEVELMTSAKRTAVCCLSSANLEKIDEWEGTTLIEDLTRCLDNVLEYFIRLAPPELHRAVYSAKKERAIGLGTLGWHAYLQKNSIPFESGGFNSAASETHRIYKLIQARAFASSKVLAGERGESPDTRGSGHRGSHKIALAPNASSSSLVGTSPSIEPWNSNAFNAQGRAGSFLIKNKYLAEVLESHDKNTDESWDKIIEDDGSVQGEYFDFLSDHDRLVFKTFGEIDPMWVVELASIRQNYICQGQSVNIRMPKETTKQRMSDIHFLAWKKGLKGLYYCRAEAATKAVVGTGSDKPLNALPVTHKIEFEECLSCSG